MSTRAKRSSVRREMKRLSHTMEATMKTKTGGKNVFSATRLPLVVEWSEGDGFIVVIKKRPRPTRPQRLERIDYVKLDPGLLDYRRAGSLVGLCGDRRDSSGGREGC